MSASNAHTLTYLHDTEYGLTVPVTEITLEHSPDGTANPPLRVYRTAGPGSDPVLGLPPSRSSWIRGRGDVEEYAGRERNLLDDGRSALRRGAARKWPAIWLRIRQRTVSALPR